MNPALKSAPFHWRAESYTCSLVIETNQDVIESKTEGVGV